MSSRRHTRFAAPAIPAWPLTRRACLLAAAAVPMAALHAREPPPMPAGGRPWRIGWLTPGAIGAGPQSSLEAFVEGLRDKGWVRGTHYTIELRTTNDARQYAALADELLAQAPDVLMAIETTALLFAPAHEDHPDRAGHLHRPGGGRAD